MDKCECGNELVHYDGALGYEAMVCTKCGYFNDVNGEEGYHEGYIQNEKNNKRSNVY